MLGPDTRSMGRFVDVVWYDFRVSKERGTKDAISDVNGLLNLNMEIFSQSRNFHVRISQLRHVLHGVNAKATRLSPCDCRWVGWGGVGALEGSGVNIPHSYNFPMAPIRKFQYNMNFARCSRYRVRVH